VLHGNIHRHLLILSLVNWAIAIASWTVSAYLGSAVPTGIFIYTILFVVGIFAAIVAISCYVLADFGSEPEAATAAAGPHQAAAPPADDAASPPAAGAAGPAA
jgi:hypothetical protein